MESGEKEFGQRFNRKRALIFQGSELYEASSQHEGAIFLILKNGTEGPSVLGRTSAEGSPTRHCCATGNMGYILIRAHRLHFFFGKPGSVFVHLT